MTSLSEQLKKLATGVTKSFEVDVKKRKSLLLNEKEAAKVDSATCYENALNAFNNLCHIEPRLKEFSQSLYGEESLQHQPTLLTQEERESLNKSLGKFITLLFPHLTLPGTLVALEWLVYKYHIHLYNVTDIMRCVFPYHETALFPKFAQLLDFKDPSMKAWSWLEPIAKTGVPLTKQELTKMCTRDLGVVLFVGESVRSVMKTCTETDSAVRIISNFLSSTLLHILLSQAEDSMKSRVLAHCQTVIAQGLKSRSVLYRSAVYTIVHCAVHKLDINKELLNDWIKGILKRPLDGLEFESAALISMILLTQHMTLNSEKLKNKFSKLIDSVPRSKRQLIEQLEETRLEQELGITDDYSHIKSGATVKQDEQDRTSDSLNNSKLLNMIKKKMKFIEKIRMNDLELLSILWSGGNFYQPTIDITSEIKAMCQLKYLVTRAILHKEDYQILTQKLSWLLTRLVPILVYPESSLRVQALCVLKQLVKEYKISGLDNLINVEEEEIENDSHYLIQSPYSVEILPHLLPLLEPPPNRTISCSQYRLLSAAMKVFTADVVKQCSPPQLDEIFTRVLQLVNCDLNENIAATAIRHITPSLYLTLDKERQIVLLQALLDKPGTFELAWTAIKKLPIGVSVFEHFLNKWSPKTETSLKTLRQMKIHRRSSDMTKDGDKTGFTENSLQKLSVLLSSLEAHCDTLDVTVWRLIPLLVDHLKGCLEYVPPRRHRLPSEGDLSEIWELMDVDTEPDAEDCDDTDSSLIESCVQQLLACMLIITTKHKLSPSKEENSTFIGQTLSIDPILSCLTLLMNNQIHNQVLLVISELAKLFPFLVVHNLVNLVTLIGQRLLPLDDSHSLHVLSRLIGSAIPCCVRASEQPCEAAVRVLAVFADCRKDIPAHRRLVCLYEVVQSLSKDWENGVLWALLALWIARSNSNRKVAEAEFERNLMLQLVCKFPLPDQLAAWSELLKFLSFIEHQLVNSDDVSTWDNEKSPEPTRKKRRTETRLSIESSQTNPLFSSLKLCLKSLDKNQHVTLLAASVSLTSQHLGCPTYISQLAACSEGNMDALIPHCSSLLSHVVTWTVTLSTRKLSSYAVSGQQQANAILALFMEVLEKIHSAVPSVHYIDAVASLLTNRSISVQRKTMDLLHTKLHATSPPTKKREHATLVSNLVSTCPLLISRILDSTQQNVATAESNRVEGLRQSGLVCCKEMVRLLSDKHASVFDHLLDAIFNENRLISDKQTKSIVLLFLAECVRQWGELIAGRFEGILTLCLNSVESQIVEVSNLSVATSDTCARLLSSIDLLYELVRNLSQHVTPYVERVMHVILQLDVLFESISATDQSLCTQIRHKLALNKKILSRQLETRILFVAVKKLVELSSEANNAYLLPGSLSLLRQHIRRIESETLQFIDETMRGFTRFLLTSCIELRSNHSSISLDEISRMESEAMRGLAALLSRLLPSTMERLLKVSLKSYKSEIKAAHLLPLFDLITRLSKKLTVEQFCDLCNTTLNIFEFIIQVMKNLSSPETRAAMGFESQCDLLIRHLLPCLSCILEAEQTNQGALPASDLTLNLIPPLVSLLDTDDLPNYESRCESTLLPAIVSFIRSAGGDEALLKPLQYELCLRSKSESVTVRLQSLEAIRLMLQELEQMFLTSLLPESLPYLAECLEDDNHEVELCARRLYNEIEILLGEPISNA